MEKIKRKPGVSGVAEASPSEAEYSDREEPENEVPEEPFEADAGMP